MSTEVKHRRGTNSQIDAAVFAEGELLYNITKKRFHAGDGTTPGGIIVPNFAEIIAQAYSHGITGGSGNSYTLTLSEPLTAYASGQRLCVVIDRNNTGAATLAVDGLAALPIKKKSAGALADVASGELLLGAAYDLFCHATHFEILNLLDSQPPVTSVGQGDLRTSVGTFSGAVSATSGVANSFMVGTRITLPGGQYGFEIQVANGSGTVNLTVGVAAMGFLLATNGSSLVANAYRSDAVPFIMNDTNNRTVVGRQTYITSSPPFDLGDGDAAGFIFLAIDKASGLPVGHYAADVPPWAYNGPTRITANRVCPLTGKKYRRTLPRLSAEKIWNGALPDAVEEEITQELKNADMNLIPHPFPDLPSSQKVVLLDPMDNHIGRLIDYQNQGGHEEIVECITRGFLLADNDPLPRKGPRHLPIVKAKFRKK